ncbi:centromere protein P [Elysia marginata]|uniref:Centromere protein P n=1 Tax=Elysia marginata TaxID=1093978 RepID=A0AAV4IN20_9GAST|nr:centromere protein P [Elysia marginata]
MATNFAELAGSPDPQLESLSKEELEEFTKVNHETISRLKADIDLLKWKLRQFGPEACQGREYDSLIRREDPDAIQALKEKLQSEIEKCANQATISKMLGRDIERSNCHATISRVSSFQLKETVTLTGFTVDSFTRRVELLDGNHCVKEFNIDGTVYNRRFRLSCTLDEEYSTESASSLEGKITWFQIQFQEDIHRAIGQNVLKAAEKIALHSAFSLLKTYLKWKKERDDVLVQLAESNPEKLSLFTTEGGNYCLKIANPKGDRPVFTVEWGRKTVDGESRILPDIHLNVEAPDKWTAMDTKNVLGSAPEIFETMITTLGIEKALKALVQLVMTDARLPETPLAEDSQQKAVS